MQSNALTGRRVMLTALLPEYMIPNNPGSVAITEDTLLADLVAQFPIFRANREDCKKLIAYYRGEQDILKRVDLDRSSDVHTTVNFAHAISRKLSAYTYSEGIQYVAVDRKDREPVKTINNMMKLANKLTVSKEVQDYQSICGTAFMSVLRNTVEDNGVPFELRFISPEDAFVVYSVFNPNVPVYSCVVTDIKVNGKTTTLYQIHTKNERYVYECTTPNTLTAKKAKLISRAPHILGSVPVVEFPNNAFRLGDFEAAIPIQDAINNMTSDWVYNIQSIATSYLCLFGVDLEDDGDSDDTLKAMKDNRIMVFSGVPGVNQDAKFIYAQIDGNSISALKNYLQSAINIITGVPDRDSGEAGSDTGVAAELRTGQGDQEIVAKTKAAYAVRAERQVLDIVLQCLSPKYVPNELRSSDIDIEITRVNRADMLTKTQSMLNLNELGLEESDVVYFGNITNDVEGVADRWKKAKTERAKEMPAVTEVIDVNQEGATENGQNDQ